jgi:uncharacterized protein
MPIIDCHVHLNKYDKIGSLSKRFTSLGNRLDALVQSMDNNHVDYSIVISSYRVDANRPSTSQIIDIVGKNENIRNKIGIVTGFTIDNHTGRFEAIKNLAQRSSYQRRKAVLWI